jgi:hypothetical protein
MIIVEKNVGPKIDYEVNGTSVCFDDDLTINLARREKDWPVHIDICSDADGALVIGAESGLYYVAQFDIPARQYAEPVEPEPGEEPEPPAPLPLDMDTVTMSLWSLENREPVAE